MLKWAVNGPRQTCLQHEDAHAQSSLKPSDRNVQTLKPSWLDKENQYTSTPLRPCSARLLESPSHKGDSLRDLSSIEPELSHNPLLMLPVNEETSGVPKTPENRASSKKRSDNYPPSTLPTFDAEYSPSALIPGPMLALRGVGIPDSYFKKPRYLAPQFQDVLQNVNEEVLLETKMLEHPAEVMAQYPAHMEESTLSSTKMGDVTLERMIDAILESNRKPNKHSHQHKLSAMSPTYTPAEDPASDLHEVWDSEKARYRQRKQKLRARLTKKILFNEQEICSPLMPENTAPGHLRRQRCLRRKRKINQITSSVVSSAQKLLCKSRQPKSVRTYSNSWFVHDEMRVHPEKRLRNLSPDSGHNSASDYEEKETDITVRQRSAEDCDTFDTTKRKLSFNRI